MTGFAKFLWYYSKIPQKSSTLDRKDLVVLGMHRSGTSLIAGWLAILGIHMGTDTHGASVANPKGFFEDTELRRINETVLKCAGGNWDDPPSENKILSCKSKFLDKIKKTIQKKSSRRLWGWKDPRTTLTIKLYQPFLKNPHFIICFRNPLAVAQSLNRREKKPVADGIHLANIYNERISRLVKQNPRIIKHFVNFENVFTNPEAELAALIQFVGIRPSFGQYYQALRFFERKYRHF